MKRHLFILLAAALVGCANPPKDRSEVSVPLAERTGHVLPATRPAETHVPDGVSLEDGLDVEEAVTLALWNNAAFQETLADLGLSRADLIQAGMLPNPSVAALIPVGAKPFELTAKLSLDFLWLRPKRVAAARLDHESTAQRLVQSGLDLIRDVKVAFADAVLAGERALRLGESVGYARELALIAEARVRAGDISELDADAVRIEALQAQERLARARLESTLADERLRHLVGLGAQPGALVLEVSPPPARPDARLDADTAVLVADALVARPDLRAAEIGLEAAGERVGLAKREVLTFAAGANGKEIGTNFLVGPAVDMTLPVFDQNQGRVARSEAGLEKAASHYANVRDRIVLEVREAHARFLDARQVFDAWHERIVPALDESLRTSERAYAAGEIAELRVIESARRSADGRVEAATSAAELQRAAAELERAIGGGPPAPTPPTQARDDASD